MARSVRAVKTRLNEAADQIEESGLPGLIVLDYTFAVNGRASEQVLAFQKPLSDPGDVQRKRFGALHRRVLRPLEPGLIEKGVIGYMLIDRLVIQDGFDEARALGNWKLAVFRDDVVLPSRQEGGPGLARTVFSLLHAVGLPGPSRDLGGKP